MNFSVQICQLSVDLCFNNYRVASEMTGTMTGLFRPTINLGNSIVGASILAMPWCFSEVGVLCLYSVDSLVPGDPHAA